MLAEQVGALAWPFLVAMGIKSRPCGGASMASEPIRVLERDTKSELF